MELRDELENDLALAMLIERRHAEKIGSKQARDLIVKIKDVLTDADEDDQAAAASAQTLANGFPFH